MSLKRKLDLTRLFTVDYKSYPSGYTLSRHVFSNSCDTNIRTDIQDLMDGHHKNFVWDDNQVGSNLMDIINPLDIQNEHT